VQSFRKRRAGLSATAGLSCILSHPVLLLFYFHFLLLLSSTVLPVCLSVLTVWVKTVMTKTWLCTFLTHSVELNEKDIMLFLFSVSLCKLIFWNTFSWTCLFIVPAVQRRIQPAKESSAHATLGISASFAIHGSNYPGLSADISTLSTGLYRRRLWFTSKCRSGFVRLV